MSIEKNDYRVLRQFLIDAGHDIKYLVTEHLPRLIIPSFENTIREFYQGLEIIDRGINTAIEQLKEVKQRDLNNHGLTGMELKRKLSIYYTARKLKDRYRNVAPNFAKGFAKRFLATIDVVLDSLAQILIPLGAVKEFKNSIEAVI